MKRVINIRWWWGKKDREPKLYCNKMIYLAIFPFTNQKAWEPQGLKLKVAVEPVTCWNMPLSCGTRQGQESRILCAVAPIKM